MNQKSIPIEFQGDGKAHAKSSRGACDLHVSSETSVQRSQNLKGNGYIWQRLLAEAITSPAELCEALQIDLDDFLSMDAIDSFALRVPRGFVARMEKGNLHDPLLKQILPVVQEMQLTSGYVKDPLQEVAVNPVPGLLHKYHGRVLVMMSGACAVNCRYCFRRHFSYEDNTPGKAGWQKIVDYIAADKNISEVIYSGGDPLVIKDEMLISLTEEIASIPHVETLRIHTRLPIVIPERITERFLSWFVSMRLKPVMVVHANHPNEIDESVMRAMQRLREAGVTLLNQSVLLRGVNDEMDVLARLSRRLFEAGVMPYYLHMLDAVQGAAHFQVPMDEAKHLMKELSHKLPGYLVPKLVQEVPGELAKCVI